MVYDYDHFPSDAGTPRPDKTTWQNPWSGAGNTAAHWRIAGPGIVYGGGGPGMMQFDASEPRTFNVLGYNNDIRELPAYRGTHLVRVGDLRVEAVWTPTEASGASVTLTAGQPVNQLQAAWDAKGLSIQRFNPTTHLFSVVAEEAYGAPQAGHAYHLALENVDHSVRLMIDGKLAMKPYETPWTAADALAVQERLREDELTNNDKPEVRIAVGGACTLAHVQVFRDLYYTQSQPGAPQHANAYQPLTLNADEFFALGDNSFKSMDGRMWNALYPGLDDLGTREGIVPRRYLFGKAFLVYWPAGFRVTSDDKIPFFSNVPLVPNAGEMRLIR